MSFITEQIQRIDAHLDHAHLHYAQLAHLSSPTLRTSRASTSTLPTATAGIPSRILALQTSIRALSLVSTAPASTTSRLLVKPAQIRSLLSPLLLPSSHTSPDDPHSRHRESYLEDEDEQDEYGELDDSLDTELEWLLVSKATTQVYGHVLSHILDTAVKLEDEVWYWDEVLSSPRATAVYSVQTSPLRLLGWGRGVWGEVVTRAGGGLRDGLRKGWREFYALVKDVVRERSVEEVRGQVLGPLRRLREEVRRKQALLKQLRLRNANALGVLLGEGLANESLGGGESEGLLTVGTRATKSWRRAVARNVVLMESVLVGINDLEAPIDKFELGVAQLTADDPLYSNDSQEVASPPRAVADRLVRLLAMGLPEYAESTQSLIREHGRPSRAVRYWLPITVGILSSSTALRIIFNRKAQIVQGIQDLGTTMIDFWTNWVVEPTRNLIKTIRHDEGSEISIMSKRSLEGDRDSLERMVVDFAVDNPVNATGSNARLTDAEIADIRAKVREGDLTPVLKAYEKDLVSPLMGSLRGNLIRALLIQIQKTKVDVEVAMGGIDALLKSQELCIGIIGLTPGLLITYFLARWVRNSFSEKRGSQALLKQGKMLRQLRNIDRILTNSRPTAEYGELAYKDQGLLLCEVHVLRQTAARSTMPSEIYKEFGEEVDELCDVRVGAEKQKHIAERIRWAYGKWLA